MKYIKYMVLLQYFHVHRQDLLKVVYRFACRTFIFKVLLSKCVKFYFIKCRLAKLNVKNLCLRDCKWLLNRKTTELMQSDLGNGKSRYGCMPEIPVI